METIFVEYALPLSMFLVVICAAAAILLPIINSLSDPKSLVKSAAGVVVLVVIYFIGYSMADGEVPPALVEEVDSETVKMIGGALTMMYILVFVAIVGIFVDSVLKFIR